MIESRERLVVATVELLRANGFHATSIKQVTDAAALPSGSLYHFFPGGKATLAEAAIRESGEVYLLLFMAITDAAASFPEAVTDFFEGAADTLTAMDYVDLCPVGTIAREIASSNDALRQATDDAMRSWIAEATTRLRAAGIADEDAADLAETLVATIEGAFTLARSGRSPEPLHRAGRVMRRAVEAALPN